MLLKLSGQGNSPALSSLKMSASQRAQLVADLDITIADGAARNRQIARDQAKSATAVISYGFKSISEDLFPGEAKLESPSWGFILTILIFMAVSSVDSVLKANISNGVDMRAKDGPSLSMCNAAFTFHKLPKRSWVTCVRSPRGWKDFLGTD